jgi:hypothetical protein
MKINAPIFGLAGSIAIGIMYSAFAVLFKLWPAKMMKFIGTIHMLPRLDLISSYIPVKVTPQAFMMGITTHMVTGFLIFFLIAVLYNKLQKTT